MRWHWLPLLAAGLPALAASAHGILATSEYIKLGESSTVTADAIRRLMGDVDARLAEGTGGESVKSLAPLVPEVRAFWNLRDQRSDGLAGHAAGQERPAAVGGEHVTQRRGRVCMSRDPVGQYRDRVGLNVEMVYLKVVEKS